MKELIVLAMTLSWWGWGGPPVSLTNELVKIHYQGTEMWVKHVVQGPLDLYLDHQYVRKRVTGPRYRKQKTELVERYFLKVGGRIKKLTPYNYKRMIRRYLPEADHLHARLGQVGFRYENIDYMIQYYNDFVVVPSVNKRMRDR